MEKKLIISVLLVFIFSLNAQASKGTFSMAGIKIESPAQNEILLEEESYSIDENNLFRCVYKMHNKGGKCNVSFSLNVTAVRQEEGLNYCKTLIPEDFAILVDGANSDFSYKNEDAVLNGQDIFKRGTYDSGTTGGIVFSLEMKPNELKTIEIDYSIEHRRSYEVNFAQNIKHSPGYKRKISIHNQEGLYISSVVAYKDGNPPGYNEKWILDIYHNYINSPEIIFERRDKELVLNFTESNFVRDAGEYALGCFGIDLKFYDSVFYVKENLREGIAEFESPVHSEADVECSEYMEIENYINSNESEIPSPAELERKYFDKSESKKDECFKIYAHILRHKNPKCEKERKELNEIFQNLNSFFSLLAGGGIGFGHESERICAYVEYELFHLQKNRLDEKIALSDSAKNDFEYILWTVGTQNVNMQQNMLDSGYLKYAKTMHEAVDLMYLIELRMNNRFYNECANRYINQVMRKKRGEYF